MASPSKRREQDVYKLMMSDYKVELVNDNINEMYVEFRGPAGSPYEGGLWKVRVELPEAYPYKSPSIGFGNKIYHPNVDEGGGSVCLDVINHTWSPMFDLINVFETFLPQLLLYPNPSDPLNNEAASLLMRDPETYNRKVKEYIQRYALPEMLGARPQQPTKGTAKATKEEKGEDGDDASSMSSGGSAEDAFASDDEKLDMDD